MTWMRIAALSLILLKHFPSLLRSNFLARPTDPDEFAPRCRPRAISPVSSCPLRPGRRLGACCLFTHTSLLLCRWKAGTLGICVGVLSGPLWGIAVLQWQRDINREITNLWAQRGRRREMFARPPAPVSTPATGLWPQSCTRTNELESERFSCPARSPRGVTIFGYAYLRICHMENKRQQQDRGIKTRVRGGDKAESVRVVLQPCRYLIFDISLYLFHTQGEGREYTLEKFWEEAKHEIKEILIWIITNGALCCCPKKTHLSKYYFL